MDRMIVKVKQVDKSNISDEEINVEDVMLKIKENIKRRRARDVQGIETHEELAYINSSWDIQNKGFFISSHRLILGKFLVKVREFILGEIRRYVDPTIWKQKEFNSSIVKILNTTTKRLDRISSQIEDEIAQSELIKADAPDYFTFEERFRGSREETKKKQSAFIKYFKSCANVLDIGCRRGEFLELLKEQGIGGRGVAMDEDKTKYCMTLNLNVKKMDVISYLNLLEDESLDGVFIDQVVEHLDPGYLINMIRLCFTKMTFGAYIIIETANPLSLVSLSNFYIDVNNKKPIHPDTLKFLIESAGFREPFVQFCTPLVENRELELIDTNGFDEKERRFAKVFNQNAEMLNSIIYGPQEYAVIGMK
jgi:2-polyprenyl-3-methyl-5-hydroxy-6-metoxy-1,4-benzoquinol methylase